MLGRGGVPPAVREGFLEERVTSTHCSKQSQLRKVFAVVLETDVSASHCDSGTHERC